MRNKETFWLVLLLIAIFFMLYGCSSKKAIQKENTNEWHYKSHEIAKDENVMEYTIDTSKTCETQILIESVEYFNDVDSFTHEQRVKAITRKTISRKKADSGQTEIKTDNVHQSETSVAADSIQKNTVQQTTERQTATTKSIFKCWWFWIIMIISCILLYIRYKILR